MLMIEKINNSQQENLLYYNISMELYLGAPGFTLFWSILWIFNFTGSYANRWSRSRSQSRNRLTNFSGTILLPLNYWLPPIFYCFHLLLNWIHRDYLHQIRCQQRWNEWTFIFWFEKSEKKLNAKMNTRLLK